MKLSDLPVALLSVGVPVSRYYAVEESNQYIVWSEDNQSDSLWADGKMQEQAIQGTVDYYTKIENDPNVLGIQEAMEGCSFRLNSVQYEEETKYIHYEWVFKVEGL